MNKKLIYTGLFIVLLTLSIFTGYYLATEKKCWVVSTYKNLGTVVLLTEEAEELYNVSEPMVVPQNSIMNIECKRGLLW